MRTFFLIIFIFSLLSAISQGNNGSLSGYILDSKSEEPLIGATIRLQDTDLGAIANLDGYFMITDIPATNYTVEASFVGYKTELKFNVMVKSGGNPDVNFRLGEDISQLEGVLVTANPFSKIEETPLSILYDNNIRNS